MIDCIENLLELIQLNNLINPLVIITVAYLLVTYINLGIVECKNLLLY